MTEPRPRIIVHLQPRGLRRDEAAMYLGIGATKFDELVQKGRLPRARRIDGSVVWDRLALDAAFAEWPENDVNAIDRAMDREGATGKNRSLPPALRAV